MKHLCFAVDLRITHTQLQPIAFAFKGLIMIRGFFFGVLAFWVLFLVFEAGRLSGFTEASVICDLMSQQL